MIDLDLRPACDADSDFLLRLRNDPATCAASRNQAPVSKEEHAGWLASVLANPSRRLMIARAWKADVGTVRLDYADGKCELSWTIAPESRRKGYGAAMVAAACRLAETEHPGAHVFAEVRPDNIASLRICEKVGMERASSNGETIRFMLPAIVYLKRHRVGPGLELER